MIHIAEEKETEMQSTPSPTTPKSWMPTAAGVLCIVAGVFNIAAGILVVTILSVLAGMWGYPWVGGFGIPLIIIGLIAITGGIFAIQRRAWGLALAGAIFSLFPPHISVLGILAIVFIAISKNEFAWNERTLDK
ncbi:MAG: hypothetical protein HYX79_10700 [Chloroflexi bacterium]|nr:hypothetical protein [Chloroflexota bacterium]